MKLKVKKLQFFAGRPVCMIHEKTAKELSLHPGDRVVILKDHKRIISVIDTVKGIITTKQIAVSDAIIKHLNLKSNDSVEIELAETPRSIDFIKKKLKGDELKKEEICEIVNDIAKNALTEAEISFFISAVYSEDMTMRETKDLIDAMVKSGSRLRLRGKIIDKHCIGGIAGNRTTPLVVSICSAAGLIMPKTSSRAITSAAGTADVMETLAKVDFSIKDIKNILKKTKACIVWGGALGLAPVDDKIIKIERIVKIDSTAQLLASILSKKISVDSEYVLVDIPYGKSAKVNKRQAEKLKTKFLSLSKRFGLKTRVVLTHSDGPIGNGIGSNLEMIDILKILKREEGPKDLEDKSVMLAGEILEMTGKAGRGKGIEKAKRILDMGMAFEKFNQILKAQKGKIKRLNPGKYSHNIFCKKSGKVKSINNKLINTLARNAGCPEDKAAGIYFHKKQGQKMSKGEKLLTIYAVSEEKLRHAIRFYERHKKQMFECT